MDELMDIDALCNLTKPVNDDDEDDEADDNQASNETILVTPESINELATKLKSLSVDNGKMGLEFANAAMEVEDASDTVRATFRKMNANKLAEKKKTSRQGNVECYFSNKNKNT